ncbi:MAG: exodeoxyribonuclease III [Pyrinomonadaceae bacterium]|nr:exodeoxyribonuclease III [Pyrinomonadaceae bacterium]
MKIATWNINSINARLEHILRWLDSTQTDVLCLQETKCRDSKFPIGPLGSAGYSAEFLGEKSYNGVAILSKYPISNVQKNMPDDVEESPKRFIAADVEGVRIVNIYVPQGTKPGTEKFDFKLEWLRRLRKYFDENCPRDSDILLCGDFNVAPEPIDVWAPARREGKIHFTRPERAAIDDLMEWGFTDVFRMLNPGLMEFSWWDKKTRAFSKDHGLRIDHIWTSEDLADRCRRSWIDREPRGWKRPSDHAPVIAEFE